EALGTFENISEGAVNLEEIVKTMEETSDRMMNVPQVFSGNNVVTDRLNRSCGPRVRGGDPDKFELIIDNLLFEGNPAPSEKTETYYTTRYNQEMVNIPVYENVSKERVLRPYTDEIYDDFDDKYATLEEFYEAYNWSFDIGLKMKWLGEIQLPLPPNTEAGYPIEVTLRYGTGGLYVRARNPGTNESIESNLEFENIKSRQEVQDAKARLATIQTRGQ
ncbi:MAG: hypothetical protein FWD01_00110, partial [Defluviitaleaceae bacterium]|nr:hypothetical protein [Defluviitaleaceae bacterium]